MACTPANPVWYLSRSRKRFVSREEETISTTKKIRINDAIRVSPVRLIDAEGKQVGIVPLDQAKAAAQEAGLDLVEVAPQARPPVVRIMDWGKYRYELQKKERAARKKQHTIEVKELKLRPATDVHDIETKVRHARRFIADGNKVKVTVMFRGREAARPEAAQAIFDRIIADLADGASVEHRDGTIVNRMMTMVLAPKKRK